MWPVANYPRSSCPLPRRAASWPTSYSTEYGFMARRTLCPMSYVLCPMSYGLWPLCGPCGPCGLGPLCGAYVAPMSRLCGPYVAPMWPLWPMACGLSHGLWPTCSLWYGLSPTAYTIACSRLPIARCRFTQAFGRSSSASSGLDDTVDDHATPLHSDLPVLPHLPATTLRPMDTVSPCERRSSRRGT